MFFKKKDYLKDIQKFAAERDFVNLEQTLDLFFDEYKENLAALSHIGFILFINGINSRYFSKVVELYPSNILPTSIFLTNIWASQNMFDEAAVLARKYLRDTLGFTDYLQKIHPDLLVHKKLLQLGVALGLIHVSSIYTDLGSLSHSLRLINYGLELDLDQDSRSYLLREKDLLLKDLNQEAVKNSDTIWEDFWIGFCKGDLTKKYALDYVESKTREKKYFNINQRIGLIESRVRYAQFFNDPKDEFFLQIKQVNENTLTLI